MAILENGVEELAIGQQVQFAHTANNVSGVLAVACTASDTTIVLSTGGGALFPNAPFYCSIEFEVLWCLSKSGDSLIVQRGQDGTTAASHTVGVSVEMRNNAGLWTDAYNAINSVSSDVGTLQSNIQNKSALPSDVVYLATTQELTHKTIDLTDGSKGNVIIGNVSPDPTQLIYPNLAFNGGFDNWGGYPNSTTLAAGTPTAGYSATPFCLGWNIAKYNDSSISATRDTANTDPNFPSATDCLLNITTVQAADWAILYENLALTLDSLVQNVISVNSRLKVVSGSGIQFKFRFSYIDSAGAGHQIDSATTTLVTGWQTVKFENQIVVPAAAQQTLTLNLMFQGVGVIAVDNVMAVIGAAAARYYPRFQQTNQDLAADVSRQNLFSNGGFELWTRGTNFPAFAGQQPICNDWFTSLAGSAGPTVAVARDSTNNDVGSQYCAAITTSGSGYSPGVNYILFAYEPFWPLPWGRNEDWQQLRNKTVTFSVRIKTSTANLVRLASDATGSATYSSYAISDNTYHTLSLTINVSASTTSADFYFVFDTVGTAYLDNASLVIGTQAADYIPQIAQPNAVHNNHLASDVARANLLTNGGFEIWQRGTSWATNGVYTADRWIMYILGGDAFSVSRDTANRDVGSNYCAYLSINGSGGSYISQDIPTTDGQQIQGRTFTFSIRGKCTVASRLRIGLGSDAGGTTLYSPYHTGDGTYQTLSVTFTAPSTATRMVPAIFVSGAGVTAFYVDNAVLVVGAVPADYVPMHPADDLARSLRYYEVLTNAIFSSYVDATARTVYWTFSFKANKPVTPTVTKTGTWGAVNFGQPALNSSDMLGAVLQATSAGGPTIGYVNALNAANGLTVESNP